ncbi:helix-turn-helix domain-containing protein [Mycolicibacterium goodii]|uniref:helix-turn-helix domain-containing protein n=1 Tax=Mycolicibacterium goodii TaxID=134601 RepID=UPI001BDBC897|nr:helix-turn-helix transcriptional regulator [Mycolicibacterium goodii]MBU8834148.1 helix-turn-helix transcriptional regulator [Mycolicibacterium goodii]
MTSGRKGSPPTTLASRLRHLRESAGMSQAEMAKRVMTGANRISDYELGRHEPSLVVLRRYAGTFGTTLSSLLDGVP